MNSEPLELYLSPTPNGWKVSIAIEELREAGVDLPDLKYELVRLDQGEQFSEEFTSINPNQKMPALRHGSICLMESCAILQYLGETWESDLLPDGQDRWDVLQWTWWQAANVGPVFGNKLSYTRYITGIGDELRAHPLKRFGNEAQRLLRVLDQQLEGKTYVCGEVFTIADIAIYPWVRAWKWAKIDITRHSNIVDWTKRVRARPGVDRGLGFGVPEAEKDGWTAERKAQVARDGAFNASNENLIR